MIELHTVEFARHADALRDAGRHLRRGLLLHGPPGTGKTLSTTYLISRLEERTVVILTGAALGLIGDACSIARDLQPSMVVLEDVDLVAQERTAMGFGATSLLFRLLNEMDGLGEDADVIFVMTTNRADLLEPALAARPGRVDQAVAFPLPDADARSRLLDLFGRGLDMRLSDRSAVVAETDGVSPAFLRELVRKAALHAVRAGSPRVEDGHFREALDLLERGGSITRAMLGADSSAVEKLDPEDDWDDDDDWEEESTIR
jgi:ATP-dependent 26S proteasome regulatory subunit